MPEQTKQSNSLGPKFHSLFTWPFGNIITAVSLESYPERTHFIPPPAKPFGTLIDHVRTCLGSFRSFLIAYWVVYFVHSQEYPAFKSAHQWSIDWMWPIFIRNFIGAWLLCGTWDWMLYFSPLAPRLKPFKINQKYPPLKQMVHDACFTSIATVCGSILECIICHNIAVGNYPSHTHISDAPLKHVLWMFFMTHIREPHDYIRVKMFHPWRIAGIPDLGRFFYRHIHKLHHKSYNTTAFSGTSMHPIEVTIYLSAAFLAIPFCVHPTIPLALLIDCGFSAWLGHGGFVFPGTGDYYHNIHHTHFDCNYGTQNIGLDWLFGSFASRESEVKYIWKKQRVGLEDNDTRIFEHEKSK